MYKEEKIPFFSRLPESLVRRFREYVNLKYSSDRYGWQSYEVELAIKNHLAVQDIQNERQQNTQINRSFENKVFKIRNTMEEIKQYFIKSGLYVDPPKSIPENHLEQAIANLRGSDKRTIRKWKRILEKYGEIKRVGPFRYEILK